MYSLKETAIRNYISQIDFKRDNWSYQRLEEDMKKFLGERPTLDVKYQKDVMINEVSGEAKEFSRLESVSIIYTDTNDKITKLTIQIE